jgi:hypothetical protein
MTFLIDLAPLLLKLRDQRFYALHDLIVASKLSSHRVIFISSSTRSFF